MDSGQTLMLFMLATPLIGALALMLPVKEFDDQRSTWNFSLLVSLLTFALSLGMAIEFNWSEPTMQMHTTLPWIPALGLEFSLALDGISIWLVLLTTFLMPIVVLGAFQEVQNRYREFHFWILILEAALLGVFLARDTILFYVCFEFTLVPLYFLIGVFGHTQRLKAARIFFLYTFTGSMLTLVALLYVTWRVADYTGVWSFEIDYLYKFAPKVLTFNEQAWVLVGLLAGFGVKVPLWPLHTWLPQAHTEAPTPGSVDLAGLVLKLGPFGLLRFALPCCPAAVAAGAWIIGIFCVCGIIIAGLVCWVQKDAKKLVAYSSVSHMGFCVLGLFALDNLNIASSGAVMYMISHGLSTGALFLCIGMLYDRFHTRNMDIMSGLARVMPIWATFFIFFIMASVGLPGLNGFVGEFLVMLGVFMSPATTLGWPFAVLAASGVIIASIYLLYLAGRIVWGPMKVPQAHGFGADEKHHVRDLSGREIAALIPLAVLCLVFGLYPSPVLDSFNASLEHTTYEAKKYAQAQYDHGVEAYWYERATTWAEQNGVELTQEFIDAFQPPKPAELSPQQRDMLPPQPPKPDTPDAGAGVGVDLMRETTKPTQTQSETHDSTDHGGQR